MTSWSQVKVVKNKIRLKITTSQRERFIKKEYDRFVQEIVSQNNYLSKREVYMLPEDAAKKGYLTSQNNYLSKREVYSHKIGFVEKYSTKLNLIYSLFIHI